MHLLFLLDDFIKKNCGIFLEWGVDYVEDKVKLKG